MSQSNPPSRSPAPFWRPGVSCHDGKLYHFGSRSAVVMRLWPEMRAWRRTPKTPWVHTRRHADEVLCRTPLSPGRMEDLRDRRSALVGPLSPDQYLNHTFRDSEAWALALATIPEQARCIASRFKERRWHVLAMLARCPGATDLLEGNPALGFALANPWILHKPAVCQPMRSMRALLRHKQARIQDWLGFPATERVRRILKRIDPGALTGRLLPQLQRALWSDEVTALLAHLPRISEEVLRWTIWPEARRRVTPSFLHELSSILPLDPDSAGPSGTAMLLCIAQGVYAEPGAAEHGMLTPTLEAPVPHLRLWTDGASKSAWLGSSMPVQLRSVAQLRRWHTTLENAVHKEYWRRAALELKEPWVPPPWAGTTDIQPLTTAADLHEEGRVMDHCVEAYAARVAVGDYAVYRVSAPMRATLGLRPCGKGWIIDQLQGSGGVATEVWVTKIVLQHLHWLAPNCQRETV